VIEGLVSGQWKELCRGLSIGYKKIDSFNPTEVSKVRLRVIKSVAEPQVRQLAVYAASGSPKGVAETVATNAAQKVWEWSPEIVGKEWQTVDIDLISFCKEACVYQVDFTAAEGKSPLEIQSLTLLQDGVAVPEFTQPVTQSLRYNLTITGLGRAMALRAVVRVSGGQKDSQGTMTLRKGQQ
jgi:hypothetical protein